LLCSKTPANILAAGEQLTKQYPQATILVTTADLADKKDCIAFADWCLEKGAPDILVNNAGFFLPGNIQDEGDHVLEQQMAANLYSAYNTTRALLPAMLKLGKGHIFNICSIASLNAYANGGSYSISKFALLGFSKNLRMELKDSGIKVTAVCPGATYTNSWKDSGVASERIMEAEDIAKMIFAAAHLSPQAVVEDIVMRPQKGDL
jgi:short-subunit dehydrogenase